VNFGSAEVNPARSVLSESEEERMSPGRLEEVNSEDIWHNFFGFGLLDSSPYIRISVVFEIE
jgi:hypothetical protein